MLKISDATNLAMHAMVYIAAVKHGDPVPVGEIAQVHGVSEAHLGKVLQRLVKLGLLKSRRGPKGGFTLGKEAGAITLLDIFEAIEGPVTPIDCLLTRPICDGGPCIMGGLLKSVYRQVFEHLSTTRLSSFVPTEGGDLEPCFPEGETCVTCAPPATTKPFPIPVRPDF
ncbi:MAG: Rrf2 family transcriptional regulator [Alphaproteobacteria bacterium CG_4_10_14_0_2_um_filter_63_37]|nr:MAG: hypothetical protein AUJ55_11510 [Proteobacteria bacterium CG1_02_64_396]PJA24776.1 MAG: Rrf2 family transcriptional regulator [Alphaproteobacteria bacterium CG_4_10_14_0_2_um_filter_63_37]